ncbi:C-X-C chemokine receptor type 1 [Sphaeramia orbicularis]|uniref:C-X-C chemokine receptor type 1-like n=1 Tax=Sphaeramia orbicularis TaxID=375764 RepID=A0A672YGP2_9TELE|nr:C-X-C chemokine receptor type 1-like [Sphaeramia orbicularis]
MDLKLQLVLVWLLQDLDGTSPDQWDIQDLDLDFDEQLFQSIWNSSYPGTPQGGAAACLVDVPGFNSLGLMIVYVLVFVFSVTGNSVVVYVVYSMKTGRASTDVYLMHLGVADLLFGLTLPFWAVDAHFGWVFGDALCKILSGFQEASLYSSVFLLACISIDRYVAVVRATRVHSSRRVVVRAVCAVVWVVAAALSLPVVFQRQSMFAEVQNRSICYENLTGASMERWRVSMRVLRHMVGFFLPLLVMTVCYSWTIIKLFHTRNQQKHKAMRVIMAVVLTFVLCWAPFHVTVVTDTLMQSRSLQMDDCGSQYVLKVMLNVTEVLAFTHCALNPILYAFIGEKFRHQFLSALSKQGLLSRRLQRVYRQGSTNSMGSNRSRNTSVTMSM